MSMFDHERAWKECAEPAFRELPGNIHDLLAKVSKIYDGLGQREDLLLPDLEGIGERFSAVPAEVLAPAARIVHCWGHWNPLGGDAFLYGSGAHWKFAILADMSLADRLGWGSPRREGRGLSIHEGILRLQGTTEDYWSWVELGLATEENAVKARRFGDLRVARTYEAFQSFAGRVKTACRPSEGSCARRLMEAADIWRTEEG